jgi:hypothetical protein
VSTAAMMPKAIRTGIERIKSRLMVPPVLVRYSLVLSESAPMRAGCQEKR